MNAPSRIVRNLLPGLVLPLLILGLAAGCASSKTAADPDGAQVAGGDEEVSVGYGTQKRRDVTSSVTSVDVSEEEKTTARSLSDLLVGRVAGVQVSEGPGGISVRIRGVNSFYGSNEPLYILDGMPVQAGAGGTLSGVNPSDVASIEVLKDAAATAIYGSRGANGVIIIKTKRGGQ